MTIYYVDGDLLESKTEALVNAVNCVGVMGKGIALQFKKKFPRYFSNYVSHCKDGTIRLGRVMVQKGETHPPIVNFPTKNHWSDKSFLDSIDKGLASLSEAITSLDIKSIAIPQLGCGEGGLEWPAVRELITSRLSHHHGCEIYVYGPMI